MTIYWISSYFIGTFLTAWWVGKWKGTDLRFERSGNLGARNAGVVLGKAAFLLTFLGDATKAALAVWIGSAIEFEPWIIAVGALAVVSWHLFPFWLKGRGGKGIAAFIGAALYLAPELFFLMAVVFVLILPIIKSATLTMLASFFAFAAAIVCFGEFRNFWPLLVAMALILNKHRPDIKESYATRFGKR